MTKEEQEKEWLAQVSSMQKRQLNYAERAVDSVFERNQFLFWTESIHDKTNE